MVDFSGPQLGDVYVEVRAKIDKLALDFARARGETKAFAADFARATKSVTDAFNESSKLETEYRALARSYDPLRAAAMKYGDALVRIQRVQQGGLLTPGMARQWAGSARAEFDKTAAGLTAVGGAAKKAGHEVGLATKTWHAFTGLVGVATVEQLGEFAYRQLEAAAAIGEVSKELGLTNKELQEYRLVGTAVGLTTQEVDSAFKQFQETVSDAAGGQTRQAKLFELLKINLNEAGGAAKSNGALFLELMDKIGQVGNVAEQKAALMLAFGDAAGPKMMEMLELGSEGILQLRESFADSIMTDEQIEQANTARKTLALLKAELTQDIQSEIASNSHAIVDFAREIVAFGEACAWGLGKFREFLAGIAGGSISLPGLFAKMQGKTLETKAYGFNQAATTVTTPLPAKLHEKPKSGGIDLSSLLAPKGRTGRGGGGGRKGHTVENQFDREELRAKEETLRLEREETSDLVRQNEIDKELIDIKVQQRSEQLDQMVHRKALTAAQATTLKTEDAANAVVEKELADRKTNAALIEESYRNSEEFLRLEQDSMEIELRLARTDEERERIELMILGSKHQQARSEIEKEIDLAKSAGNEERVAELTEQRVKMLENQNAEIKAFNVEHLRGFEKFRNDLPKTVKEINQAINDIRMDRFLEKLQQAAQFTDDVGDAFGNLAGDLARGVKPLQAFTSFINKLADTFTENFIVKPVSDWAKQNIGGPLAKQAFGKDLMKQGGLNTEQMNLALALASNNLETLAAAAAAASSGLGGVAAGGAAGAGGLSFGIPDASGFDFSLPEATDMSSMFDFSGMSEAVGEAVDFGLAPLTGAAEATTQAMSAQIPILGQFGGGLMQILSSLSGAGGGGGGGGLMSFLKMGLSIAGAAIGGGAGAGGGLGIANNFGAGMGADAIASNVLFGFDSGGFTGGGYDDQVKGYVHANEWVADPEQTRRYRPLFEQISAGRLPSAMPGGDDSPRARGRGGSIYNLGGVHIHGARDDRSARRSARQGYSEVQRQIAHVRRSGLVQ